MPRVNSAPHHGVSPWWWPPVQRHAVRWSESGWSICLAWAGCTAGWVPETQQPLKQPSLRPSPLGKSAHACSSRAESGLPTALLLLPVVLQPAKGACLPRRGSQDWGAQSVAWTAHSPGQISTHISSLFLWLPSRGHRSQPEIFSSLPTWLRADLSYSLGWKEFFCQFPGGFPWELFHL